MKTIYKVTLEIGDVQIEILEFAFTYLPTTVDVLQYLERKKAELLNEECSVGCAVDLPEINLMTILIDRIKDQTAIKAYINAIDLVDN
jgi:hypothetical protein